MSQETTSQERSILVGLLRRLAEEKAYWQAEVIAKRLVESVQDDPEVWYLYGLVESRLGHENAAAECLAKALELSGPRVEIAAEMCYLDGQRGDLENAIEWCRRGLDLEPANPHLHRELARLHARMGDTEKAARVLEVFLRMPAIESDEANETRRLLGFFLTKLQRYDEALALLRQVAEADAANHAVWTDIGRCLSRKGETKEAIEAFERAARMMPDARNLYNLGDAYLGAGRVEEAVGPLAGAVRKDPDLAAARYDLGLAYFELGRFDEADAEARAAIAADPDMLTAEINLGISATTNLGLSLIGRERYEEAIECFKRNEKQFGATFFNMGLALFRARRLKEALRYFRRALAIEPADGEIFNLIGQCYTELGKYKEAEKNLRKSIELRPDKYWGYYDLGNLFLRIKDKRKEAKALLEKAIELAPDYEWSYYCLGCWHALAGRKAKAFEWLEKALDKGFKKREWMEKDKDLDGLRKDPRYAKLLEKGVT